MSILKSLTIGLAASVLALPALAADITVEDPYARSSGAMAKSGAAFMRIVNTGSEDDRLIAASSEISARVELHTHVKDGDIMRMIHVEEGFELPAGGEIMMERGGKHVMFLGLEDAMEQGNVVEVTLTFEKAGDLTIEIPVDLERMPSGHGHGHGHSHGHNHGDTSHSN